MGLVLAPIDVARYKKRSKERNVERKCQKCKHQRLNDKL